MNYQLLSTFILSLLTLAAVQAGSSTSFSVSLDSCSGSTDTFTLDSTSLDCSVNSYGYCYWGGQAGFKGSFSLGSRLDSSAANVTAYAFGAKVFDGQTNICKKGQYKSGSIKKYTSKKGQYCPAAGTYVYKTNVTLPKNPNSWAARFGSGSVSSNGTIAFDFEDGSSTSCTLSIAVTNKNSSSNTNKVSGAVLVLVFVGMGTRRRRRRTIAMIDAEALQSDHNVDYESNPQADFEMMKTQTAIV
jgi:hypothetical protein